ncbi:DUF1850 domain-containing protein [Oceanimonas pelagia]|uniref:DUF1850 domain-containing protein n=1 Tax=Oceanimonas pelagia TaxID=3028314 RepID=A0AA50Q834_9GAMM|nr:DUF1850 domain-containing protein [Oceanimonas pelagia]WMC11305.1 DUF1850 domain-containing protein [Oceanimonas pelagia]
MICLLSASTTVMLLTGSITLSWQHSVEKTRWEETYRAEGRQLRLIEASVQGSGAGMEPPPEARLEQGVWRWQPNLLLDQVTLAGSAFTGEYTLCDAYERCHPLSHWLPPGQTVTLAICDPEAH